MDETLSRKPDLHFCCVFFTKPFCCFCYWEILSFVVMLRYYVLYTFPESVKAALSVMFSFYSVVILLYTLLLVSLVYAVHSLNYELFILCFSCMTKLFPPLSLEQVHYGEEVQARLSP